MFRLCSRSTVLARVLLVPSLLLLLSACEQKRPDTADFFEDETDDSEDPSGDETAPLISLDAPTAGQTVSGMMSWAATASDDVAVAAVKLYVDDAAAGVSAAEPWGGEWDSTSVTNGSHVVKAIAEDAAGNQGESSVDIIVANEEGLDPDAILITNPADGASVCGEITVETAVSDEVVQVTFTLNGADIELDTTEPFYWEWDTTTTFDGAHEIVATASAEDGRQAVDSVAVTVINEDSACDNAPSVVFTKPDEGAWLAGSQEVEVTASDDVGVVSVAFYVDSGLLTTDTSVPYETALATGDFEDGAHVLKAVATDTGGQTAEAQLTVYTDNTEPVIVIDDPGEDETLQGTITWAASAMDNIEVAEVWFLLDDEVYTTFTAAPYEVELDTTALERGEHTLVVTAYDGAGNEATDTITVSVDNPPEITFTAPDDTEVSGVVTVSARATDDDLILAMALYQDGVSVDTETRGSTVSASVDTCDETYGSTLEFEATAQDSGGNTASETLTLTVNQPLQVEIGTYDGAADYVETLSAKVSDDQSISRLVFALDGTTIATVTGASGSEDDCFDCGCALYETTWSTASASEGAHTLSVTATNAAGETATDSTTLQIDYDQDDDGFDADFYGGDDCDDEAAETSPDTVETCDGEDENCDGEADESFDADADGYLDETYCSALTLGTDCDDTDAAIRPDATESCDDVDNNCDGAVDMSGSYTTTSTTFSTNSHSLSSSGTYGNVYKATTNAVISSFQAYLAPGSSTFSVTYAVYRATSATGDYTRVASGTGSVSGATGWFTSPDLDVEMTSGYYYLLSVSSSSALTRAGDSTSPSLSSGGGLTLAGYTYNSSATATTISADPATSQTYYQRVTTEVPASADADTDADGYSTYCGDCDESDATVSPGGTESCDGEDEDCNGEIDDTVDADADGEFACDDCDDGDSTTYTGATEYCDDVDNDCDGEVDNDPADGSPFYRDHDGDGYGGRGVTADRCGAGSGWSAVSTDCDDLSASVYPGASEACNGSDDDCDGSADEGLGAADRDGDGYNSCGDCDDTDADISPDAAEICDNDIDEDCDDYDAACAYDGTHDMGSVGYKWRGEASGDYAGYAVDGAGDMDGDGFGDVAVGAYQNDGGGSNAGSAYLVFGPVTAAGQLSTSAVVELTGESSNDWAGVSLAGLGDQDGDGYDDLVIGASLAGSGAEGMAYVLLGPVTADASLSTADILLSAESLTTYAYAGSDVKPAGDVNGDGAAELLIGASGATSGTSYVNGIIYLMSGPLYEDDAITTSATAVLTGVSSSDAAGQALAGEGDVDGDGYGDILVGVFQQGASDNGAAYAINGPISGTASLSTADSTFSGASSGDYAGSAVCFMDADLDGYADAVVGASRRNVTTSDEGAVYLNYGPLGTGGSLSSSDVTLSGAENGGYFGDELACADVNNDGYDDLLVGAPREADGGTQAGVAWLFFGPITASASTSSADASFIGEDSSDMLGEGVGVASNVDGDGLGALLLGASTEDHTSGTTSGSVYVLPFADIP